MPAGRIQYTPLDYAIREYALRAGALEIEYIEEFFNEYPRRKTAAEIVDRLSDRDHSILMAEAPLSDDPSTVLPVSYKVAHEIRPGDRDSKLADLVVHLQDCIVFNGRKVLYQWIGGTRRDWRGQGHFRALTEQQEVWALENGFDEAVVKTKNRFYEMRSTLDQLHFEVVKYERNPIDNSESKVYLSKKLGQHVLDEHRSRRSLIRIPTV